MKNYENEKWLPCPGFEDHYEVSDHGRLRSRAIFIPHDGSWNKDIGGYIKKVKMHNQQVNRYGYLHSKLCKYGKCNHRTIHRLVATAFLENPNKHPQVNHIDGNKMNNHVDNLEWVSRSGNIKHAYDTGLMNSDHLKGSKHHNAKLTEDDVRAIRASDKSRKELMEEYGISYSTLKDVLNFKSWKHVI